MPICLSTHWNAHRHKSGQALVEEILGLGIDHIELGYNLTIDLVPGVKELIDAKAVTVASVHNFCPVPVWAPGGHPELFLLSSTTPQERERAVTYTLKTIEFAQEVGARAVVTHPGRIQMKHLTPELIRLAERGGHHDARYAKIKTKMIVQREKKAQRHLDCLAKSLETLVPAAEAADVRLGLENLPSWEAIPCETEILPLLEQFNSPSLGYWHDTGHGQVRQNLGFITQIRWLEKLQEHIVGWHIHDVRSPAEDHLMPPRGNVDFTAFKPFVSSDSLLVLEPAAGTPPDDVREGTRIIREALDLAQSA